MTMAGCYSPTVVLVPVVLGGPGLRRETGLTEVSFQRLSWTLRWHRGAQRRAHAPGPRRTEQLAAPDAALPLYSYCTCHRLYSLDYPSDVSSSAPVCCRSGGPRQQKNNKQPSCGGRCGNSLRGAHVALNALASSFVRPPPLLSRSHPPRPRATVDAHGRRCMSPRLLSLGPY